MFTGMLSAMTGESAMYDHDYFRRVCERSRMMVSARNQGGTLRSTFEDYHDPSMEMARILQQSAFTKEYVMKNLMAVYTEYMLIQCDTRHDPEQCRKSAEIHVDRAYKKYCRDVREFGIPNNAKEVKYPTHDSS